MNIKITLPVLYLFQFFPKFKKKSRRLMIFKKMKKIPQNETARAKTPETFQTNRMGTRVNTQTITSTQLITNLIKFIIPKENLKIILDKTFVAYAVETIVWNTKRPDKIIFVNNLKAKTDQKSTIIVINQKLVERFRLKFKKSSKLNPRKMCMSITNGKNTAITNWVKFWVKVVNIGRKV